MKTLTFCISLLCTLATFAQMPKAINYQAVARNAQGQAIASQPIKVRLSVLNSAAGNAVLYSETRNVTTTALGLFSVQIGSAGAVSTSGNFSSINWVNNTTSTEVLKVELDATNSGNFTDMGSQTLATVPYAFAADVATNALNIGGHYVDTNTPKVDDVLRWDGSAWVPTSGAFLMPTIVSFNTPANVVSGGSLAFAWAAQPVQVTIKTGQRITASIAATLGTASGTATQVGMGVCYQAQGGTITHFYPANYTTTSAISARQVYTASGTVTNLAAGTYNVGFCLRNTSPVSINSSDGFNGFIMITNQ